MEKDELSHELTYTLDREIASMGRRFAAYFIDRVLAALFYLFLALLFMAGCYALARLGTSGSSFSLMREDVFYDLLVALEILAVTPFFSSLFIFFSLIGYLDRLLFAVILRMSGGFSPGKRMLGIRVVRLDGKPLGWETCLLREVVMKSLANQFCLGFFLPVSFIYGCTHQKNQTLQDLVVETIVIKEN